MNFLDNRYKITLTVIFKILTLPSHGFPMALRLLGAGTENPRSISRSSAMRLGVLATSNRRSGMRRLSRSVLAVAFAAGLSIAYAGTASASSSAIAAKRIVIGPRQSIQQAVDNAKPGTTIVLRPGVYHQMVLIRKDKITLRGSGARRTVIKPPRHATSNPCTMAFGETGICIVAKKVGPTGKVFKTVRGDTISNLSVVGFHSSGVFGYGTVGLTVRHVTAINDGDYGISRFNSTETRFTQDVAVGNHEAGFYVGDSPDADTVVRDDRAVGNQLGIFIRHAREVMVSRNYVAGNCQR